MEFPLGRCCEIPSRRGTRVCSVECSGIMARFSLCTFMTVDTPHVATDHFILYVARMTEELIFLFNFNEFKCKRFPISDSSGGWELEGAGYVCRASRRGAG